MKTTCLVAAALVMAGVSFSHPAAAQVSDGVVKIGILTDISGGLSDSTGMGSVLGARMAIEDFGGKVLGKPIELVYADHLNKADVGAGIARKWFEAEQVDAVFDLANSAVALAVQGLGQQMNRITVVSSSASSDLTGKACSPTGIHWTYDTYSLAHVTGKAAVRQGAKRWFFITADYAFGHALERDTVAVIQQNGGTSLGSVKAPLGTADFSSFLLQAQASKAEIIGLVNSNADFINSVKQASEFGVVAGGQKLSALLPSLTDIHSLGLPIAQGLQVTTAFYWDQSPEARAFSRRFFERHKRMPEAYQAGDYGAVMHYLKAIEAAGTDDATAVMAKMRATPINDFMTKNGRLREDGRVIRDMYYYEVKSPAESKEPWDYYKLLQVIPGDEAYRPLSESECPLVKKG